MASIFYLYVDKDLAVKMYGALDLDYSAHLVFDGFDLLFVRSTWIRILQVKPDNAVDLDYSAHLALDRFDLRVVELDHPAVVLRH